MAATKLDTVYIHDTILYFEDSIPVATINAGDTASGTIAFAGVAPDFHTVSWVVNDQSAWRSLVTIQFVALDNEIAWTFTNHSTTSVSIGSPIAQVVFGKVRETFKVAATLVTS